MSRYRRRFRSAWLNPATLALLLMAGLLLARRWSPADIDRTQIPVDGEQVLVLRAVDGDTLLLQDGRRIRLLGVDTPETKHPDRPAEPFGPEAASFTAARVGGRQVRLEYDRERFDDYGRWLAYVYVDGELLNELLIREGLSQAENAFPFRSDMKRLFTQAQEQARSAQRGIWSTSRRSGP